MKILIFAPYYPPHIGGVETYVDELSKYLSKKHQLTIITPQLPKNTPREEIKYTNVKILRFPAFEIVNNFPVPKFWTPFFWKIFNHRYDIIISQTRFFLTTFVALIFGKITKTKIINVEHGSAFITLSNKLVSVVSYLYDKTIGARLIFKNVNTNIAISKTVANFIEKFKPTNKPVVIYRGIEMQHIDNAQPNMSLRNKYHDKIIILSVGRLTKWKGVRRSIQVVKSLPKNIQKKIIFLIIGDGEDYNSLNKMIVKNKNIVLLGKKTLSEVYEIAKIADIFIHSSLPGGGLATTLLEAMYCRCAIVASPHEGACEPLKNQKNGFLTNNDFSDASPLLLKLIQNKNIREKFSRNAQQTVVENFNWQKSIEKYEKEFEKLIK